jgi:hypothetical protein
LVEEAAADGRESFGHWRLSADERRQIITLPATIAKLAAVEHLYPYGSNLVRIPPEIGAMTSLEEFTPYTSHRLHWFPYKITRCPMPDARCPMLRLSTVSTRSLYGNYRMRPAFPALQPPPGSIADLDCTALEPRTWGPTAIRACSICDRPIQQAGLHQVWISLRVATDVLPLLVNACSPACIGGTSGSAGCYVATPHTGGPAVAQRPAQWAQ